MFKKLIVSFLLVVCLLGLISCNRNETRSHKAMTKKTTLHKNQNANTIIVGTMAGPETKLMETVKKVAKKRYDLNVKIVTFSNYNTPNAALNAGEIDANAFQHTPFLDAQIKARKYKLVPIGKTFVYPMGLYSTKIKSVKEIKRGDIIAIPNDPSNEARALALLQQAKLIRVSKKAGFKATPLDIYQNRKFLKFVQLDAAELPRVLNDVTAAVINTNYAIPAGLSPDKDAIYLENKNSPYANLIVVRKKDKKNSELLKFVKAYQSAPVILEARKLFGAGAIPAWDVKAAEKKKNSQKKN